MLKKLSIYVLHFLTPEGHLILTIIKTRNKLRIYAFNFLTPKGHLTLAIIDLDLESCHGPTPCLYLPGWDILGNSSKPARQGDNLVDII